MLKRVGLLLVVVALLVSIIAGCSSKSASNPVGLVPEGVNLLGQINLSKILTDEEITALYDKASKEPNDPQTFEEALGMLEAEYGIDLMNFNTITFFSDTSELEGLDSTINLAIIVEGTFDKGDLLAAIEDAADEADVELKSSDYKGYDVYTAEDEEGAFVFLSDKMLALGSRVWIEDVIDVAKGDGKPLSGVVLDTYNDLDEALLKVAVETVSSGQADEKLPDEMGELLGDLSAFEDIKTVGITLGRENSFLAFDTKLCAADKDSAEAIEQAVDGMITFLEFAVTFSDDPESLEEFLSILEEVEISTSGSCVDVRTKIALSGIEELMEGSTEGLAGSFIEEFMEGFLGTSGTDYLRYQTDAEDVQLMASTFYADVHSGRWDVNGDDDKNNPSSFDDNVWGDADPNNTLIVPGHYYPTAIAKVSNHILTLSATQSDPDNPDNPRMNAGGVAATDAIIQAHAIWMGLLANYAGDYTSVGGTTDRWEVSPLDGEGSLYLDNVPDSTAADANYNGDLGTGMEGSYCWVVGQNGYVFGVYRAADGYWYSGFNGTYP